MSQLNTGINNPVANANGTYTQGIGCAYTAGSTTAVYCPDSSATQIVKIDRATYGDMLISMGPVSQELSYANGTITANTGVLNITGGMTGHICVLDWFIGTTNDIPGSPRAVITSLPGGGTVGCSTATGNYGISISLTSTYGPEQWVLRPSGIAGEPHGQSYSLASDAVQGAYSVTLTSAPSGINIGDIVLLDEDTIDNGGDPNSWLGPYTIQANFQGFANRYNRTLTQLVEVSGISGSTITFDFPVSYPFHTANAAQLTQYTGADADASRRR